jgi:Flp pilus assembly pilin Flp
MDLILKFTADEAGAPSVEYAVLLGVLALSIIVSIQTFSDAVASLYNIAWP